MTPAERVYASDADRHPYGFRKCCEAVRQAVPLPEIAGRYTGLRRIGSRYLGRCPITRTKVPLSTATKTGSGGVTVAVAAATLSTSSSTAATTASCGRLWSRSPRTTA